MSVFDKEIIINGKAVRSPEQQVYKNMKDIEELQAKIKPVFLTSEDLTSSSVSIATADTNIGEATEGWLITGNALLFRIDGNDGSTVLLTYACDLNGPVGPTSVVTAAATVGATVGTPSVTVVKTGTDENPLFTFNFTNLKGEPGDNLITVQVVDSLPASGTPGILYFVANSSGESQNAYDEYIYNNGNWEKLGQAQIDLSNYIQKSSTSGLVKNDGTIDTTAYTTLNLVYPIGSVYTSVNSTSPASLFGGTWQALNNGNPLYPSTTNTPTVKNNSKYWLESYTTQREVEIFVSSVLTPGTDTIAKIYSMSGNVGDINQYESIDITNGRVTANLGGVGVYMWKRTA